jgi:Mrp family chromosome partitioning ATPase
MSKNYEVLRLAGKDIFGDKIVKTGEEKEIDVDFNGNSRFHEEVLKFVQRVFLSRGRNSPRSVVLSSVGQDNSSSWICAHAAESLAACVDDSVCAIAGNLRVPSLDHYLGIQCGAFLLDSTPGQGSLDSLAKQVGNSNLWLVSYLSLMSDSEDGAGFKKLEERFAALCSHFKYVLVDAPPANEFAELMAFARIADAVVLVLEAHAKNREVARTAKLCLESANVRLLGAILNKCTSPIP